jgi:hypothetical protein
LSSCHGFDGIRLASKLKQFAGLDEIPLQLVLGLRLFGFFSIHSESCRANRNTHLHIVEIAVCTVDSTKRACKLFLLDAKREKISFPLVYQHIYPL